MNTIEECKTELQNLKDEIKELKERYEQELEQINDRLTRFMSPNTHAIYETAQSKCKGIIEDLEELLK